MLAIFCSFDYFKNRTTSNKTITIVCCSSTCLLHALSHSQKAMNHRFYGKGVCSNVWSFSAASQPSNTRQPPSQSSQPTNPIQFNTQSYGNKNHSFQSLSLLFLCANYTAATRNSPLANHLSPAQRPSKVLHGQFNSTLLHLHGFIVL